MTEVRIWEEFMILFIRSSRSEQRRPEERLDVDDGLRVGHVVLLGDHGALLVHHHHGVGESHPAPQQAVKAGGGGGRNITAGGAMLI